MIDPYLRVLLIFSAAVGILILLFILLIIILRVRHVVNEKRFRSKSRLWEGYFFDYLQGEIPLDNTVKYFKRETNYNWLRLFFTAFLEKLDGPDFEKTKILCQKIGLIDYYRKKLHHSTNAGKALAAKTLGALRHQESVPQMVRLLRSNNPVLVQAAADGLSKSGDTDSFIRVARALLKNTYFTYEGTAEILTGYGEKICPIINQFLKEESQNISPETSRQGRRKSRRLYNKKSPDRAVLISLMVNLIGYYRYEKALPQLDNLLKSSDEETTVHILKTFMRIEKVPPNLDIKPFLTHYYWVIRSFGAQIWIFTGDSSALPQLEKMLSDRHWWVRFHTASALKKAGTNGLDILKRKTAEETGAAADISRYVINLKEVN